jgi:hypothetical protein
MTATDPHTTPVQPTGPPTRRHHRVRNTLAGVLAVACLAGAVTAAYLALTSGHHPAPPPHPAASTAPANPFSPSAAPAAGTMAAWCAGPGYAALQAVHRDISQVGADAHAGDMAAVQADGPVMTADAEAAEKLPPPVTHAQQVSYVEAMGALSFAGIDMSAGNITAADRAIAAASGYLGQDQGIITC